MTFIVHGATGAQGSPVLTALRSAGHDAAAAVRDAQKATGQAVPIDNTSVESLIAAYTGTEGVFIHLPLGSPDDQVTFARNIAEAVTTARPGRVVFSTSGYPTATPDGTPTAHGILQQALEASGVSYAVIAPKIFLENLLLPVTLSPAREEGVLRYPIRDDYAVSWISHLDMADIAARLLTDTTVTGIVTAGALPALLGRNLAEGFARYLDRPVEFESQDPEAYGQQIIPIFGADAGRPVIDSYHARWAMPGEVIDEERSAQKLLGIRPRPVEQWLREINA
ncbi:NAD(P)H-binding protein [Leucobacter sp. UT-8R-CII-1-4]|uniref:SDR family oxidoreductase n=1 Tax=Leucobacter sp. UT-8R-CII-1-4 TaxID=3040075 RepID=UPI0024A9ABAF|nr:NAD(P)H-binding protein [Leucobacter sp. UT-8R-CII-1-4]MDI6024088.1 NAD(P)H-binding protein [Leucobacter sp. UT-8R-CII-1-4]